MPQNLTAYRVFIASPGGLGAEREAFRDTVLEYSQSEALYQRAQFFPIGWEDTQGGSGRPQSLISAIESGRVSPHRNHRRDRPRAWP